MKASDKSRIEPDFNRASTLWHEGKPAAALKIFRKLDAEVPNEPVILGMLAAIHFSTKNYMAALEYFKQIVGLSPKSELASRGLYHCLWAQERYDEALEEARRFLKLKGYSKEYSLIMEELDEQGFFDTHPALKALRS